MNDLSPAEVQALVAHIEEARQRVAPLLPDVDPGDLLSILECLYRPFGSGKVFFLREERPGVYVF